MHTDTTSTGGPDLARMRDVVGRFPVSRSWLYRAAAEGKITLRKLGAITLVDLDSLRAVLADLPEAQIRRHRLTTRT